MTKRNRVMGYGVCLWLVAMFVCALSLSLQAANDDAKTDSKDRPNILFIISDEHNANVLGCYGNTIIETPNLDRLAADGITFDAAYTNSPLCVPARLSFTSGKYISRTGAWSNNCWLPSDDYPSIAQVMKEAGYDLSLIHI